MRHIRAPLVVHREHTHSGTPGRRQPDDARTGELKVFHPCLSSGIKERNDVAGRGVDA